MKVETVAKLVGRILLCLIFIVGGAEKIARFSTYIPIMAAKGIPFTRAFLVASLVIELAGGLMLLLGFRARLAAFVLFLYLIPVTLVMHGYWRYAPDQQGAQQTQMLKNAAIMGGLLYVVAAGSRGRARIR